MSNIICYGTIFAALFIFGENLTLFGVGPVVIAAFLSSNWEGYTNTLTWDSSRLWGPAFIGMYAWYLIDYLKSHPLSEKVKRNLTIGCGLSLAAFLYWTFFWSEATLFHADVIACFIAFFSILNMDGITVGANKMFQKVKPLAKSFASLGLGYFLFHYPVMMAITALDVTGKIPAYTNGTSNFRLGIFVGILTILAIAFIFIDNHLLKPIIAKLTNLFGSRKPIVIEEPSLAAK